MKKRAIICGYFSIEKEVNTVGDLMVLSTLTNWLKEINVEYDIISDFLGSEYTVIPLDKVIVDNYDVLIFVCGPIFDYPPLIDFIQKFRSIKRIALNVSVIENSPIIVSMFDTIIPRDSSISTNYDMALEYKINSSVPVIGLILVGPQHEYLNQRHSKVEEIIGQVLNEINAAVIRIDTKVPYNEYELKNEQQIASTIAKMDMVITTRLHGSLLALKEHVPFIAIDPIPKSAKVSRQVNKIGWPYLINVDDLTSDKLIGLVNQALSVEAKKLTYDIEKRCMKQFGVSREQIISVIKEEIYE